MTTRIQHHSSPHHSSPHDPSQYHSGRPRSTGHPSIADGAAVQLFTSRLDREWQHLRHHRRALATARRWSDVAPHESLRPRGALPADDSGVATLRAVLDDLDDLQQIVDATQGRSGQRGPDDAVMLRLVEVAQADELAGRVVIQRLLPGLVTVAMRYRHLADGLDPVQVAVSAAWVALRSYDVTRRRRNVAASLLSDTSFIGFRRQQRRRSSTEEVRSPDELDRQRVDHSEPTALEQLADVVRDSRDAGVPARDLELICHLVRAESPNRVARERAVSTRTVRNHRERAVTHIREALIIAA